MPEVTYVNQTNTTQLPAWMQSSIQDILNRATGIANEPYQPYTGPTVAGFSPDQQASFQAVRNNMSAPHLGWAGIGSAFAHQAGMADSVAAGQPSWDAATGMFNAGAGVNSAAMAQPLIGQGTDYLRQSASQRAIDAANPYIAQSVAPTGLASASPYIQASTMGGGLSSAQPYLSAAGTTFPGSVDAYMNPYISGVTDRIAELGARNLNEYLLPGISDQFIRAGQFGSAQQRDVVGRALRDTQESILGQQAQSLERGYGQAGQLYGQDAARMAQLAGTAGGLGSAQQQQLLAAGQALGGLGQNQQQLLQNAGATLGGLSSSDLSRLAQAGINIGQFGLGQGQLAGADASRQIQAAQGIAGIGNAASSAAATDAARQAQVAQILGGLGTTANNINLQNAGALGAAGDQQQAQVQANYNAAQGAFNQQQQQPWQNLSNLSSIIHGLPMSQSSTSTQTNTSPSPSMVSQIGGLGLGAVGLANSRIFRARGGAVRKRYAAGGRVRGGGISSVRMAA